LDTLLEPPLATLSGVARVLVHAGKLSSKAAEDLAKSARERKIGFIAAVIASGAVSAVDLAHTLSTALALPLVDLSAVDIERLPKGLVDAKLAGQYQVVVLGRRGNRLFIRSEERRVGKECRRLCRSRWSPYH
jgi:type IV pilus assembly protein PilB